MVDCSDEGELWCSAMVKDPKAIQVVEGKEDM